MGAEVSRIRWDEECRAELDLDGAVQWFMRCCLGLAKHQR